MNANELANSLMGWADDVYGGGETLIEAATMLRQQQAEIEALKQIIDANNLNQNIGQFVKPTNEPVMWMYINKKTGITEIIKNKSRVDVPHLKEIPLYTHPVEEQDESFDRTASHMAGEYVSYKAKLTDEEIADMVCSGEYWELSEGQVIIAVHFDKFARAILKKASEK
jgi:hypothetical protein